MSEMRMEDSRSKQRKPGRLVVKETRYGAVLHMRWGSKGERYIGVLWYSAIPIFDCILENAHRLDVDDLHRLQQIDKGWGNVRGLLKPLL